MCRAKPLALYVFIDDNQLLQEILGQTTSGAVVVNDNLAHAAGLFIN